MTCPTTPLAVTALNSFNLISQVALFVHGNQPGSDDLYHGLPKSLEHVCFSNRSKA
jgi:hypothetical protein